MSELRNLLNMIGEPIVSPSGAVTPPPPLLSFPDAYTLADAPQGGAPLEYIAGGLVQHKMLTLISGPPKARKSFLLMDLAVAIAGGGAWLGKDATRARVLLVDLETVPHYLTNRLEWIVEDSGNAGLRARENLTVLPWRHVTIQPGATPARMMEAIRAQADKCQADVVLIDSVYLMLNGDESDPLAVADLLKELVRLSDTRAVVFTHHYAKGSASAQAQKSAIDRASGSSWWSRFADVLIPLTPPVQEPGDTRQTLVVEPSIRHHPQMAPISIEWTEGPRFRILSAEQTETLQQRRPIRETQNDLRQAKNAQDREVQVLAEVQELSEGEGSVSLSKLRTKCKSIATGGTFTRILERLEGQKRILHFQDKKGGHRIRLAQEVVQLRFREDPPPGGLVDVELEDGEIPEQTLEEALRDG